MTKFAVIIPAYQAANTIGRALSSALSQEPPPDEVVVCDDGSTDHLLDALQPYLEHITLVRQRNSGLNAARNAAIRAATSEWVVLLDADDEWLPGRLSAISEVADFALDGLDIITTDAYVRKDDQPLYRYYENIPIPSQTSDQKHAIIRDNFVFVSAAVRLSALKRIGLFTPGMAHDSEYEGWLRLILSGSRVAVIESPLAIYDLSGDGHASSDRVGALEHDAQALDMAVRLCTGEYRSAVLSRRRRVYHQLAIRRAAMAVSRGDRMECLRLVLTSRAPLLLRTKLVLAAIAPRAAMRRLSTSNSVVK